MEREGLLPSNRETAAVWTAILDGIKERDGISKPGYLRALSCSGNYERLIEEAPRLLDDHSVAPALVHVLMPLLPQLIEQQPPEHLYALGKAIMQADPRKRAQVNRVFSGASPIDSMRTMLQKGNIEGFVATVRALDVADAPDEQKKLVVQLSRLPNPKPLAMMIVGIDELHKAELLSRDDVRDFYRRCRTDIQRRCAEVLAQADQCWKARRSCPSVVTLVSIDKCCRPIDTVGVRRLFDHAAGARQSPLLAEIRFRMMLYDYPFPENVPELGKLLHSDQPDSARFRERLTKTALRCEMEGNRLLSRAYLECLANHAPTYALNCAAVLLDDPKRFRLTPILLGPLLPREDASPAGHMERLALRLYAIYVAQRAKIQLGAFKSRLDQYCQQRTLLTPERMAIEAILSDPQICRTESDKFMEAALKAGVFQSLRRLRR